MYVTSLATSLFSFPTHFIFRKYDNFLFTNELATIPPFLIDTMINWDDKYVESFFISKSVSTMLNFPVTTAVFMGPALGCQLHYGTYDEVEEAIQSRHLVFPKLSEEIRRKVSSPCVERVVKAEFTEDAFAKNQTRAVVVIHKGVIVGEGYQSLLGITEHTKLLGWSMTKSLHSAIVGAAVQAGIISLDTPVALKYMSEESRQRVLALNGGKPLTFADLLQMNDILEIEENYGIFADVAQMLYGTSNYAEFASKQKTKALSKPVNGASFGWYYSSGVSNLLASELRDQFPNDVAYLSFPRTNLFSRIGAESFAVELDTEGTMVASSFGYATARDWGRLGELLLNNGTWDGQQVLPAEYVDFVQKPHPGSAGHYGGQFWLNPARVSASEYDALPHNHPDKRRRQWMIQTLPADAYCMNGYLGQSTVIIPSMDLVIVRLAHTKDVAPGQPLQWDPKRFYGNILQCIRTTEA